MRPFRARAAGPRQPPPKPGSSLARGLERTLNVNIEIDVGLHRGGVEDAAVLDSMLRMINAEPRLRFTGFMGYDAHCTLNTAGSLTLHLHEVSGPANELSVGSAAVKPSHFDLPALAGLAPAAFIATPVLKSMPRFRLPVGPRQREAVFTQFESIAVVDDDKLVAHWPVWPASP